jgi:hypothetical protein
MFLLKKIIETVTVKETTAVRELRCMRPNDLGQQ